MTNKIKNEILYRLQTDDILCVAKDMGIPKKKITPEVIRLVVKGWECGLQWYEVTQIALEDALDKVENQ